VQDAENPYRTLQVRGTVESIETDVDAAFYQSLQRRYDFVTDVFDADIRVVVTVRPTSFVAVDGGVTSTELQALTEQLASEH